MSDEHIRKFIDYLEKRVKSLDWLLINEDNNNMRRRLYERMDALKKEIKVLRGRL